MALLKVPAEVTHKYDVSSIEKIARKKRAGAPVDRTERIFKQIMRLTEEEQHKLMVELSHANLVC